MTKLAFFCHPYHGHLNPTLGMVSALVEQKVVVHYYTGTAFKPQVNASGAIFVPISERIPSSYSKTKPLSLAIFNSTLEKSLDIADHLMERIEKEDYDYYIFDFFTLWARMIRSKLPKPAVATYPLFVQNMEVLKLNKREVIRHFQRPIFSSILLHRYRKLSRQILKQYPLKALRIQDIFTDITADLSIVFTTADLQPCQDQFDNSFHFVGPSFSNRIFPENSTMEIIPDKPMIYISMGTVFVDNIKLAKKFIQTFGNKNYQVVMAYGMSDPPHFQNLPNNITIKKSVNPFEILKKSDLFITHSGFNSVMEAIWFEVPMICFPRTADQNLTARMVERYGLGLIAQDHISKHTLIQKAASILQDKQLYQSRLKNYNKSFNPYRSGEKAANIIMEWWKS